MKGGNSTPYRKKLIEVALPLEAINAASAREKSIRHGHPSTLHLWWARRPLAACRAVLFASIVDDPSSRPEEFPTEEAQERERQRLFGIIERLVLWENTNNEQVLNEARQEILKATNGHPPPVLDPFCGGGSIPLEAQRLGLEAHASDLNPVAVLITKALIEIPPKFAGMPPVNPEARKKMQTKIEGLDWPGATGLAEDVRYYGRWMRDEAEKRIGHLYPKAKLPDGSEATVIAWLWARTVKCPNPACGAMMPLMTTFWLSKRKTRNAWIEYAVNPKDKIINFKIKTGEGQPLAPPKTGRGAKFRCLVCGQSSEEQHIKDEGMKGLLNSQLIAIVAQGRRGRIYLSPNKEHIETTLLAQPKWEPEQKLPYDPRNIWCTGYGLTEFKDLFTHRQLATLTVFSELINDAREHILKDISKTSRFCEDNSNTTEYIKNRNGYAESILTYLALAVDRLIDYNSNICSWIVSLEAIRDTFARQAIPMVWDFAEANPLSNSVGSFNGAIEWVTNVIGLLPSSIKGDVGQFDSSVFIPAVSSPIISTDPPYYDNISYADLSDFFYIWLRKMLGEIYPDIFSTLLTPKSQELIASPYRFGGSKDEAKHFFEDGLSKSFANMRDAQNENYPLTVFYAFKQAERDTEKDDDSTSVFTSTGWETMIEGLIKAGLSINGTWPIRTERSVRNISLGANALASSIVLVCRPRFKDAPLATRRDFINALKKKLPLALRQLQKGNIAPVDLAQAAIGPGMAIFSRYSKVLEADGSTMRVRTALQLINQHLDEYLSEQEGEYDPDTRWALSWFEQYGMNEGPFGDAETLSKAKNTSVQGMVDAGILKAGAGKAKLLRREEMRPNWDPTTDRRLTVWEATQYLIRILEAEGENGASELQQKLGGLAQSARDLAYRLYSICERQGWSQEAQAYNSLVTVWPRLQELAVEKMRKGGQQTFEV